MTRRLRRIDWAALGASVGSAVLFTLLLLSPLLCERTTASGCSGLGLSGYFYLRRER
jgi:hypothetical protein